MLSSMTCATASAAADRSNAVLATVAQSWSYLTNSTAVKATKSALVETHEWLKGTER
jgi:hypothetical protein